MRGWKFFLKKVWGLSIHRKFLSVLTPLFGLTLYFGAVQFETRDFAYGVTFGIVPNIGAMEGSLIFRRNFDWTKKVSPELCEVTGKTPLQLMWSTRWGNATYNRN